VVGVPATLNRTVFDVAGSTSAAPSVRTVNNVASPAFRGEQTYNDAVLLRLDTVLAGAFAGPATAGGDISFNGTVDSYDAAAANARSLTVNTSAKTQFGDGAGSDRVGGTNPLLALVTDDPAAPVGDVVGVPATLNRTVFDVAGSTSAAPSVRTVNNVASPAFRGEQTYNDAVLLRLDTVLAGAFAGPATAGGDISFNGTVDSYDAAAANARSLTVNTSAKTQFGDGAGSDRVGGTNPLLALMTDDPGAPAGDRVGVPAAANRTVFFVAGSTSATPSVKTVNNVAAPAYRGEQIYSDAGGVWLQSDTVLASTWAGPAAEGGTVLFDATVDSYDSDPANARSLTVNTSGFTYVGRYVGFTHSLGSLLTDDPWAPAIERGGATVFDVLFSTSLTPTVTTVNNGVAGTGTGNQTYCDAVLLSSDTVLASWYLLPWAGVGGDIGLYETVDSDVAGAFFARSLTVNTSGTTRFGDGDDNLDANGPNNDWVGNTNPLAGLLTDDPGAPDIERGGTTVFDVSGSTLAHPTVTTVNNGGPAAGKQTFNDADGVRLKSDTVLASTFAAPATAGGDIVFNDTVDSYDAAAANARSLTVNTSGTTQFGDGAEDLDGNGVDDDYVGQVNPLRGLVTDDPAAPAGQRGGTTVFNVLHSTTATPTVTTRSGSQTYNDSDGVLLKLDTVLTSVSGGNIELYDTVDSYDATARSLTVNTSGTTRFGDGDENLDGNGIDIDWVGLAHPLANLTTDAGGTTRFAIWSFWTSPPAPVNVLPRPMLLVPESVRTTDNQTYNDEVRLRQDTALVSLGGTIKFGSTVYSDTDYPPVDPTIGTDPADDTWRLFVDAAGTVMFDDTVGGKVTRPDYSKPLDTPDPPPKTATPSTVLSQLVVYSGNTMTVEHDINIKATGDIWIKVEHGNLVVRTGANIQATGGNVDAYGNVRLLAGRSIKLAQDSFVAIGKTGRMITLNFGTENLGNVGDPSEIRGKLYTADRDPSKPGMPGATQVEVFGGDGNDVLDVYLETAVLPRQGMQFTGGTGKDVLTVIGKASTNHFCVEESGINSGTVYRGPAKYNPALADAVIKYLNLEFLRINGGAADDSTTFHTFKDANSLRFRFAGGGGKYNGLRMLGSKGDDTIAVGGKFTESWPNSDPVPKAPIPACTPPLKAGATVLGATVTQRFQIEGVANLQMFGSDGNDTLVNNSSVNSLLDGGRGSDALIGGQGNNVLLGGEAVAGDKNYLYAEGLTNYFFVNYYYFHQAATTVTTSYYFDPVKKVLTPQGAILPSTVATTGNVVYPYGKGANYVILTNSSSYGKVNNPAVAKKKGPLFANNAKGMGLKTSEWLTARFNGNAKTFLDSLYQREKSWSADLLKVFPDCPLPPS
jgi:hypothetical protein